MFGLLLGTQLGQFIVGCTQKDKVMSREGIQGDFFEESFEAKIESQIQEKGLVAPRITKQDIDELMGKVKYTVIRPEGTLNTLVTADLYYSEDSKPFTLAVGFAGCVSPLNYNAEIGATVATRDAEMQARDALWKLEGYALMKALHEDVSMV